MKASEARKLADLNPVRPVIDLLLQDIYGMIQTVAKEGKSSIASPLFRFAVTADQQQAVWEQLIRDGYRLVHHPDPDPGNRCNRSYTSVSW